MAPERRGRRTECAHLAVAGTHHAPTNGTEECQAAGPRPARSVLEQGDVTAVPVNPIGDQEPLGGARLPMVAGDNFNPGTAKAAPTGGPSGPALTAPPSGPALGSGPV